MAVFIRDVAIVTVADMKAFLADFPDDTQIYAAVGELACIRVYQGDDNKQFLEVE